MNNFYIAKYGIVMAILLYVLRLLIEGASGDISRKEIFNRSLRFGTDLCFFGISFFSVAAMRAYSFSGQGLTTGYDEWIIDFSNSKNISEGAVIIPTMIVLFILLMLSVLIFRSRKIVGPRRIITRHKKIFMMSGLIGINQLIGIAVFIFGLLML